MAHSTLDFDKASEGKLERKLLELDKLGVIGGFLTGLAVSVAVVDAHLSALDVSQGLVVTAMAVVTAVFTRAGQHLGIALAARAERASRR